MKILLFLIFHSLITFSAYARSNSLDGTVLLYLPGLGNTPLEYEIRLQRINRYKSAMAGIDDHIIVDGVHTGLIWDGTELEDKFVSIQFYLEQLTNTLSTNLYYSTIASIIIDKRLPSGDLPFNSEINNFLQDLLLDTLTLTPQNSDLENILIVTGPYLASKKRVINIGYSQGSLYDNITYSALKSTEAFKAKLECQYGSYHQGSGVPSILNPMNDYVVVEKDFLSQLFDKFGSPHLAPNYRIPNPQLIVIKNAFHGFLEVYWNPEVMAQKIPDGEILSMTAITMKSLAALANRMDKNCGKPPVANFTFVKDPTNPMNYTFDASTSTDPDVQDPNDPTPVTDSPDFDILTFDWYVDGLKVITGVKPQFTFAFEGEHSVKLVVTDREGNVNEDESMQIINVVNQAPIADFTYTVQGLKASFNASASKDDGRIVSYKWKIETSNFTTLVPSANRNYPVAGTYYVELFVVDNNGKPSSVVRKSVTVGGLTGCVDQNGISYPGKKHTNPDGSLGGFVADTASVAPTVTLSVGEICETSQILGNIMMYSGKITGNSVISGAMTINESTINNSNLTSTSGASIYSVQMKDSRITARGFSIYQSDFSGVVANIRDMSVGNSIVQSSSFSGDLSIDESKIYHSAVSDLSLGSSFIQDATIVGSSVFSSRVESSTVIGSSIWYSNLINMTLNGASCMNVSVSGGTSCPPPVYP